MEEIPKETNVKSTIEAVTGLVKAVPIYDDALQPAAKQVGKSLETVAKSVNIALTPLKLLVWGYEQIEQWLNQSVTEKLKDVPEQNIVTPNPQIAGPTVEALRFTGDNDAIRDLYANLLATAMNSESMHKAHPGYVEIVKNLCKDEAIILKRFLANDKIPFIDVRMQLEGGYNTTYSTFTFLHNDSEIVRRDLIPSYIDNLCRLGVLCKSDAIFLTTPNTYEPLMENKLLEAIKEQITLCSREVGYGKGVIMLTDFGRQFVQNVVRST